MANSPQEEQSSQLMTPGHESPENPQNMPPTFASTPEAHSDQSVSSDSVTTLRKESAEVWQAIESRQWETMLALVGKQTLISNAWNVEEDQYPANYQGAKGEPIRGFNIVFDEDYGDQIATAVSKTSEGNLPLHVMTEFVTKTQNELHFVPIKRCISILSEFGRAEHEQWWEKNAKGKNALHIAALCQGRNSEHVIRALFELMVSSSSDDCLAGLDDGDGDGNTALHLAALNIPRTALYLTGLEENWRHESMQPFNRLLRAGANPWKQNRSGDTVLHLLNKERQAESIKGESESNTWGTAKDSASVQNLREAMRIQAARDILRQQGAWKPQLVATNGTGQTAMSLALLTKDYALVGALAEASQTPSFVLEGDDAKRWVKDGTTAFDKAVGTLDADLDPIRGDLIRNLAEDGSFKDYLTRKDQSGLTALHKACNLTEDRFDIVKALLSGTNIHERAGPPRDAHGKGDQRFANWSALTFATRRAHNSTALLLLEQGIMNGLTPSECSEIRQLAYDEGNLYIAGLIQHFRTHDLATLHEILTHDSKANLGEELRLSALKWPRKGMRSPDIERKGFRKFSEYRPKTEALRDFDYCSYPERRLIHHLVHGDEGTSWNTWTKKNGGWIHLPANNWKWIESVCRSSYINEEKLAGWLDSHLDQSSGVDKLRREVARILEDTYMNEEELWRAFPQLKTKMQSDSYSPMTFAGIEGTFPRLPSSASALGRRQRTSEDQKRTSEDQKRTSEDQKRTSEDQKRTSEDQKRRHSQLSIECQKTMAFLQDSLREVQQHGAKHRQVRQGFRSLVVQRQEQLDEPNAPNVPGAEPKPGPANFERYYNVKSVVNQMLHVADEPPRKLPVLDIDWMLSYLEVPDHGSQEPTRQSQASDDRDLAKGQAYRIRSAESKAIVKEDMAAEPDRRGEEHWKQMEKLYDTFKEIRKPLSLDQYFYHDLKDGEVQERISSQVVSRFIHYQHESHKSQTKGCLYRAADPPRDTPQCQRGGVQSSLHHHLDPRRDLERGPDVESRKVDSPQQQILIVPQLWLFTVDNTVVTSYPDRWDRSNVGSSLSSIISKRLQTQPRSMDSNGLLHKLLECAMQFNPSFRVCRERFTYEEAFSGEIGRLSRLIEQSYEDFHRCLGQSDDVFLDAFRTATYCYRTIDDVLRELSMIKRVYQDQIRVWEDFHNAASSSIGTLPDGCNCPYSTLCEPKVLPQRLLTTVANLVEEAKIVQESAVTLLTLLQGEASTENSIRTFQQSKILGIFTVVTVIFAPLSWIAAVFALQVKGTTWTWLNVFGGSFGTVMITLLVCAMAWMWLDWKNIKGGLKKD